MGTQDNQMSNDDERRRFFRVEDAIHLGLRPIPRKDLDDRLRRLEQDVGDSFTLMTSLSAINQQVSTNLRRIEQDHPDIAEYLKALDKKLDLLARAFLFEEVDISDKPVRAVNLSAGGLSVRSTAPMEPDTVLEIKMLLMPSFTGILTFGTVVDCVVVEDGDTEFPYQLRVDFSFIRDGDRDALIRHVLLKQAEWLRRRRERRERTE